MQIIPKSKNALRRSILLYRRVRYRKGYGVHSPFVYNLITKVIEESGHFYLLDDIALTRLKLQYREELVSYPDKKKKGAISKRPSDSWFRKGLFLLNRVHCCSKLSITSNRFIFYRLGPIWGCPLFT